MSPTSLIYNLFLKFSLWKYNLFLLLAIDCCVILFNSFKFKDLFKFLNSIINKKPKQNSRLANASKKKLVQNKVRSSFKQLPRIE